MLIKHFKLLKVRVALLDFLLFLRVLHDQALSFLLYLEIRDTLLLDFYHFLLNFSLFALELEHLVFLLFHELLFVLARLVQPLL